MSSPFAWVPADAWGEECGAGFFLREDLAADLVELRDEVRERGGVLTSSGGTRPLTAEVTPARSPTSLHYLGRAVDLCIWRGMQTPDDPYAVAPEPGRADGDRPFWRVYCLTGGGEDVREVETHLWTAGAGTVGRVRRGSWLDLTFLFEERGWSRIPARPSWRTSYLSVEWWHFERRDGLVPGVTTFGDELRRLYLAAQIEASPLVPVLGRVWNGRTFVDPAAT